jgi:hypothetical protein
MVKRGASWPRFSLIPRTTMEPIGAKFLEYLMIRGSFTFSFFFPNRRFVHKPIILRFVLLLLVESTSDDDTCSVSWKCDVFALRVHICLLVVPFHDQKLWAILSH